MRCADLDLPRVSTVVFHTYAEIQASKILFHEANRPKLEKCSAHLVSGNSFDLTDLEPKLLVV